MVRDVNRTPQVRVPFTVIVNALQHSCRLAAQQARQPPHHAHGPDQKSNETDARIIKELRGKINELTTKIEEDALRRQRDDQKRQRDERRRQRAERQRQRENQEKEQRIAELERALDRANRDLMESRKSSL